METPDTIEGFLTECIMERIGQKLGPISESSFYNPLYSCILEVLNERLPEIRSAGKGLARREYIMRGFC